MNINTAVLINQTSAEQGFEYYTPAMWTDAAKELMGAIDLDPASCEFANSWIRAKHIWTKDDDGLSKQWFGRVWMNHPFHRGEAPCKTKCDKKTCIKRGHHIAKAIPGNSTWITKLLNEYKAGHVSEAVIITFCNSSETWFLPLLDYPQCFPRSRVHYVGANGKKKKGCTKGSVITYLGTNIDGFSKVFGVLGKIKVIHKY